MVWLGVCGRGEGKGWKISKIEFLGLDLGTLFK